jgi:hypothetical protein
MGYKTKLEQRIAEVRRNFSDDQIRAIFAKRTNDELLASVGVLSMSAAQQKTSEPHLAVWLGMEYLTGLTPILR